MELFKNTNGKTYEILQELGDYTLLHDKNNEYHPYVIAWDLDKERGDWSKGRYRNDLESAKIELIELAK